MKYFSDGVSLEEAKVLYRQLAQTMHPDHGGDADEFVILANEYAKIKAGVVLAEMPSYEEMVAGVRKRVLAAVDTLNEVYPRTSINIEYNPLEVKVRVNNPSVPFHKLINILDIMYNFGIQNQIVLYFKVADCAKWYTLLRTDAHNYFCNISPDASFERGAVKPCYEGRRYVISRNKTYEMCVDNKTQVTITLKRTPKFTLQELMGL